ncbi:MAG: 3'-5' exonuclease [Pyrinomonadaceae bacterium]
MRYRSTPLTRWLEDCAAWCAGGWREGLPRLSPIIRYWLFLHRESQLHVDEVATRRKLVDFLMARRSSNIPLKEWYGDLTAVGLSDVLTSHPLHRAEAESLKEIGEAVADDDRLGAYDLAAFGGLRGSKEHLNLVTLHSSKGLEFDVVVMMGMDHGRIPRVDGSSRNRLQSRRLFYVGLTRAKREVHIVYSGWYESGGQVFKQGPSEFVRELQQSLR